MDTDNKPKSGAVPESPPVAGSASDQIATWRLVAELRNALAAAMRTIAARGTADEFLAEAHAAGVRDGIGDRTRTWLDTHWPNAAGQGAAKPYPAPACSQSGLEDNR